MFVSLNHTDIAADPNSDAIIASAQARSVPVISAKQALDMGRRARQVRVPRLQLERKRASVPDLGGRRANGLRAMLPMNATGKTLTALSRSGTPVAYSVQRIKGIDYAFFDAVSGVYAATYS